MDMQNSIVMNRYICGRAEQYSDEQVICGPVEQYKR